MDSGATAWILTSAALVLLMTPGLALFYGGMVRGKSVLNMMMMSLGALALIGVLWVLWGYSIAFGDDVGAGLLGSPLQHFGLGDLLADDPHAAHPVMAFAAFQATFAAITVAIVSGAIADRVRFGTWMLFAGLWGTLVYFPVAHWVFDLPAPGRTGGWIVGALRANDFAGGTAVEVNSGAAGLALALVVGARRGFGREVMRPHNLPLVMLGAGLLWFGWFGFNAGSALAADTTAAVVWMNTLVAPCAALLGWLVVERCRDGHATSLGAASGAVAGLVAITPSCNALSPVGSIVLGAVAGAVCAWAVGVKHRLGYDDSLDVVGVHLVGGVVGTLGVGLLAAPAAPAHLRGLLLGGGADQLWRQAVAVAAVLAYSFTVTLVLAVVLRALVGWRIPEDDEVAGIDQAEHAESAYDLGGLLGTGRHAHTPGAGLALHRSTTEEART